MQKYSWKTCDFILWSKYVLFTNSYRIWELLDFKDSFTWRYLEITDFNCFLISTLSFFITTYSQAVITGMGFFFYERGGKEAVIAVFKDCVPSTPKDVYILRDILPCWKGPEGWYQAENEPTPYSLITDKAHLILTESSVWPADQEQLFALSTQFW